MPFPGAELPTVPTAHATHKTIPTHITWRNLPPIWSFVCTSIELQTHLENYYYCLMDSIQLNLTEMKKISVNIGEIV